jgi:hypothetical protein
VSQESRHFACALTYFSVVRGVLHSTVEALPASDSMLVTHELVRSPEEDLRWKVSPQFAAKWTLDGDGLERKLVPTRRHIAAATLACHHECLAISGCREHASMIADRLAAGLLVFDWINEIDLPEMGKIRTVDYTFITMTELKLPESDIDFWRRITELVTEIDALEMRRVASNTDPAPQDKSWHERRLRLIDEIQLRLEEFRVLHEEWRQTGRD